VPLTADLTEEALAGDYELETGKAIVAAFAGLEPLNMRGPGRLARPSPGARPGESGQNIIVLEQVALIGS